MLCRLPAFAQSFVLATLLAQGCGDSASTSDNTERGGPALGLFEACDADTDCASSLCSNGLYSLNEKGVCTEKCSAASDCAAGDGAPGSCQEVPLIPVLDAPEDTPSRIQTCVLPCTASEREVYECKAGERLFCDDLTVPSCKVCGCAAGSFCDATSEQCESFRHGGDACDADGQCLSNKCQAGLCTSGAGDPCDGKVACDGSCGGPASALYCLPACVAGRCPTDLPGWACLVPDDESTNALCSRVCRVDADCKVAGVVCQPFASKPAGDDQAYTGFCTTP